MPDEAADRRFRKDLNAGLIALVLLALLAGSERDLYAYEIARLLAGSGTAAGVGGSRFSDSALYPVLRALARDGMLTSRIVPSYSGPPRRYYRITDDGRARLAQWREAWRATRDFVDGFV